MNLLLHIGTHKTATTSIQQFLALNRKALVKQGFFYPKGTGSAYTFNDLPPNMVYNKQEKTKSFIENACKQARKKNAHTLVISAESFYAMTGFFRVLVNPGMDKQAYIANEEKCIKEIASYCKIFDNVKILCCIRSQEDYATSLYNQLVKSVKGITDDYVGFLNRTALLYDYNQHIDLWEKHFGKENINVFHFNDIKSNPVKYFCDNFLKSKIYDEKNKALHSNERLSRDVLEFKREQNKTAYEPARAFAAINCYHQLSEEFPDKGKWQIYAPLEKRKTFFEQYNEGNEHIKRKYNLALINAVSSTEENTYPGLNEEKRKAIEKRLNRLLSSPIKLTGMLTRRFLHLFIKKSKLIDRALNPLRNIRNEIRLRLEGW